MYVARQNRKISLFDDFSSFLRNDFLATSLDEDGDKEARPDFRKGSLLIEIKTLEIPPTEKIEKIIEPMRELSDFPFAYGKLNEKHFVDHTGFHDSQGEILKKIQKSVRDHLKKANRQIREYASSNGITGHGIVIFLNEKIPEFNPEAIMHAIKSEIKSGSQPGRTGFESVNSVLYISEKHFFCVPQPPFAAYSLFHFQNSEVSQEQTEGERILELWAKRASSPNLEVYYGDGSKANGEIYIIPEKMKKYELWQHNYRKNRKFCSYNKSKLAVLFCQVNMRSLLCFHKNTAGKSQESLNEWSCFATEVLEEINLRGLDLRSLMPKKKTQRLALDGLKISSTEREWLRNNFKFQIDGETFTPK